MQTISVGSIVEAKCGKCNDTMGHTVVVMVGGNIMKVECRACKSVHRFRPAGTSLTLPSVVAAAKTKQESRGTQRVTRPVKKIVQPQDKWIAMTGRRQNDTPIEYQTTASFVQGNLIHHTVFGIGEVTACIPPDKIDVLFETGIKRLLHNKS